MNSVKISLISVLAFTMVACSSLPQVDLSDEVSSVADDRRGGGGLLENRGIEVVPLEGETGFEALDLTDDQLRDRLADEITAEIEPIIYFGFDQYSVDDASLNVLRHYADVLLDNPSLTVKLEGHTDERGSPAYNLALGERRAIAVLDVMKAYGIAENRMMAISFGEERPVVLGQSEEAYSMNRRVELNFR
jgi:peptidoglycan-associated lipoprotein